MPPRPGGYCPTSHGHEEPVLGAPTPALPHGRREALTSPPPYGGLEGGHRRLFTAAYSVRRQPADDR
jgi:hypothetical protein